MEKMVNPVKKKKEIIHYFDGIPIVDQECEILMHLGNWLWPTQTKNKSLGDKYLMENIRIEKNHVTHLNIFGYKKKNFPYLYLPYVH